MYQVLNVKWSGFLKGILPTLQSHGWSNGTHGVRQLGSGDLGLLPMTMWLTGVLFSSVGIMAAHGVSQTGVFATSHPTRHCATPPHPTTSTHLLY